MSQIQKNSLKAQHFGRALQFARRACGTSQEAFDLVSSRTYVSAVERGLKTPTVKKIAEFAEVLGLHPISLMALSYVPLDRESEHDVDVLLDVVRRQLLQLLK